MDVWMDLMSFVAAINTKISCTLVTYNLIRECMGAVTVSDWGMS